MEKEHKFKFKSKKGQEVEHASIPLPQGTYEIKIQEEYDDTNPTMKNKVKD